MDYNYENLLVDLKDGILTITLNRPDVRNAFNWDMQLDLNFALVDALADEDVRVIILTGAGDKAFSGGLDLKKGMQGWYQPRDGRGLKDYVTLLAREYTKPIIAAVNGYAVGWGCTITLLCDIRIASENAQFSMRFTQIGLIPEGGSPLILPAIVGLGNALELGLTAKTIDAREALRIGLVNKVVPLDQLMSAAREMAESIAEKSPLAIGFAKRGFWDALEQTFEEEQKQENTNFGKCVTSQAFSKKRKDFAEKKKD